MALDPAALIADERRARLIRRLSPINLRVGRSEAGHVLGPMNPFAFVNPTVIHRTAELLSSQAPVFAYREAVRVDSFLPRSTSYSAAVGIAAGQALLRRLITSSSSFRGRAAALQSRLPPGSSYGPEASRLAQGRWRIFVAAMTLSGRSVEVSAADSGHPGSLYGLLARRALTATVTIPTRERRIDGSTWP